MDLSVIIKKFRKIKNHSKLNFSYQELFQLLASENLQFVAIKPSLKISGERLKKMLLFCYETSMWDTTEQEKVQ